MKKSDLRTGMKIVYRTGWIRTVLLNTNTGDWLVDKYGAKTHSMQYYSTDMYAIGNGDELDIMKVYKLEEGCNLNESIDGCTLVWQRKKPKQINMTVAEIEAQLDIKNLHIVKGDE